MQAEPIFLSADEVEQLARATRGPYDVLVRLAVATGLRPSELCGLRVGQERLGHSSTTVTMDVYGHLLPFIVEALTERLDDVSRAARLIAPAAPPTVATIG